MEITDAQDLIDNPEVEKEEEEVEEKKEKKWDHLTARPDVFKDFRAARAEDGIRGDSNYIKHLLNIRREMLSQKE